MTHDEYVISGPLRRVVVVTRGGPGSGFKKHKGRPGKVGGSLPKNAWTRHGFSIEEFTKKPDLPREQVPELGKDVSIVYSGRGNKARWVAAVRDSLERFRNATGFAPQGITITDHLPWVFWRSTPYEVLANMPGADGKEIANVLMTGPFAAARGVYVGGNERTIYVAPELAESLPPNLSWTHELGLQDFHETMAHELGHWLTMTAAPVAYQMVAPNARYREVAGRSYPSSSFVSEYAADLVASLARPGGRTWPWRLDHATMTEAETRERQDLMERIRHNLVLRTAKEQPGRLVMVLMGDEIVAVPEVELGGLPEGAIINPLYLWWKEHFQPKVELDLDAKAFGWEAEDIAVQGEPEDGIFAVVEEVQRPKRRKETMAEAAGQEEPVSPGETPAPVPPEGEAPAGGPGEADVKSAFETIMRAIFRGGAGSGHFGHKGRPGKVGGSLSSGEVAEEVKPQGRDIWTGVQAGAIPVGTREVDIPRDLRFAPGGSPIRGTAMSVDDSRIGDRVYHMTTALDAVSQAGELSARGVGGLGGDKADQIVSMTVSREVGEQLVRDMRMMAAVAREFGPGEPIYEWDRETHIHQRLDPATGQPMDVMTWLEPLLNRFGEYAPQYGFSFSVADVAAFYGMQEEQVGTMDYTLREWGKQFFMLRNRYTGVQDPLFFSDAETLARIDPAQVGLVAIPRENLRTGALLTDFDLGRRFGLEEVRLYGDVPLNGAEFIRDIPPATPKNPSDVQRAGPQALSRKSVEVGLVTRLVEMLEKVRVPVVHVDVAPADIHFHAPEQPASIVNLTLPETTVTVNPTLVVPPAEVTVNVPPHPKHMTERQTVKRSADKTITEITGEREYWDDEENTGG